MGKQNPAGWLALVAALFAGCAENVATTYRCSSDDNCRGGMDGWCEASGYCSFPDASCATGRRYGAHAVEELAEQCADNPAGHWPFDEAGGTLAKDVSGRDNHGTLVGGASRDGGKVGTGAVKYDGVDDLVVVPHHGSLTPTPPDAAWSFSAWIQTSFDGYVMYKGWSGAFGDNDSYSMRVEIGRPIVEARTGIDHTVVATTPTFVADGEWHHIAGVRVDPFTMQIYVDGRLEGTATMTGSSSGVDTDLPLQIGGDGRGNAFTGLIDDVRVYERALTATEIADRARP